MNYINLTEHPEMTCFGCEPLWYRLIYFVIMIIFLSIIIYYLDKKEVNVEK